MDASIFDSALSHTRRSDASKNRKENSVSTFGRFRLWTSFESSPVSVKYLSSCYEALKKWFCKTDGQVRIGRLRFGNPRTGKRRSSGGIAHEFVRILDERNSRKGSTNNHLSSVDYTSESKPRSRFSSSSIKRARY